MKSETYSDPNLISQTFCKEREVLIQVFTSLDSIRAINTLIAKIKKRIPHAKILGTSAGAKIVSGQLSHESTTLVVSTFCCSEVHTGIVQTNKDLLHQAASLTRTLTTQSHLPSKVAIVFSEGLHIDGEVLLTGISNEVPDLVIAGGMASDSRKFKETFVFTEDGVTNSGFVIALLSGKSLSSYNHFNFNWIGLGRTFTVTKAKGNRVWELDNIPIIDIYKRYLGDNIAQMLPSVGLEFPMIISNQTIPIARAVMIKHDDGSLSFAGSIHEGMKLRFGFGDSEGIIIDNKKENFFKEDKNSSYFHDKPVESLFVYSCVARLALVGKDIEQETLPLEQFAPANGFYTYGEFYHEPGKKCNLFLNQTMTILGLSEGEASPVKTNTPKQDKHTVSSLYSSAMSHFVQEITTDMEKAIEAEKKSKEIMLHQSRQATMGETIEIIAHQWRQPLNIIALVIQDLYVKSKLSLLTPDIIETQYDKANASLQYLSQTIDDFRDFMRPENEVESFTLNRVIDDALFLVSSPLKKQDIVFDKQSSVDLNLRNRKNALLQVFLILLHNAIDSLSTVHTKEKKLSILVQEDGDKVVIEVCDNGGGVADENLLNIFEPYFTTKSKSQGTGMGLYIASNLVKNYLQGSLEVKNINGGACFILSIAKKCSESSG